MVHSARLLTRPRSTPVHSRRRSNRRYPDRSRVAIDSGSKRPPTCMQMPAVPRCTIPREVAAWSRRVHAAGLLCQTTLDDFSRMEPLCNIQRCKRDGRNIRIVRCYRLLSTAARGAAMSRTKTSYAGGSPHTKAESLPQNVSLLVRQSCPAADKFAWVEPGPPCSGRNALCDEKARLLHSVIGTLFTHGCCSHSQTSCLCVAPSQSPAAAQLSLCSGVACPIASLGVRESPGQTLELPRYLSRGFPPPLYIPRRQINNTGISSNCNRLVLQLD